MADSNNKYYGNFNLSRMDSGFHLPTGFGTNSAHRKMANVGFRCTDQILMTTSMSGCLLTTGVDFDDSRCVHKVQRLRAYLTLPHMMRVYHSQLVGSVLDFQSLYLGGVLIPLIEPPLISVSRVGFQTHITGCILLLLFSVCGTELEERCILRTSLSARLTSPHRGRANLRQQRSQVHCLVLATCPKRVGRGSVLLKMFTVA